MESFVLIFCDFSHCIFYTKIFQLKRTIEILVTLNETYILVAMICGQRPALAIKIIYDAYLTRNKSFEGEKNSIFLSVRFFRTCRYRFIKTETYMIYNRPLALESGENAERKGVGRRGGFCGGGCAKRFPPSRTQTKWLSHSKASITLNRRYDTNADYDILRASIGTNNASQYAELLPPAIAGGTEARSRLSLCLREQDNLDIEEILIRLVDCNVDYQ